MSEEIDDQGEVQGAAKMPDRALIFMRLAAPFRKEDVRERKGPEGRILRYVTARTIMNRLDEVVGPWGWSDHYEPTPDGGFKCSLSIRLPDGQCVIRQDVGARKKTSDPGDAEKGAISDAFKRAAVKLGVGRYLYPEGVPSWIRKMQRAAEAGR